MKCSLFPPLPSFRITLLSLGLASCNSVSTQANEEFRWVTTSGPQMVASFSISDQAFARGNFNDGSNRLGTSLDDFDMRRIDTDISGNVPEYLHGPLWFQRVSASGYQSNFGDVWGLGGTIAQNTQTAEASFFATFGTGLAGPESYTVTGSSNTLTIRYRLSLSSTSGIARDITSTGYWGRVSTSLGIQIYAGLTITGSVGKVYTVQYSQSVGESAIWQAAALIQLASSPFLWVDASTSVTNRRFYRVVEGPTNLVRIPSGTYTMGSPSNELERGAEGPLTVVTVTRELYMGKCEVTQREYAAVMGNNPSYFRNGMAGEWGIGGEPIVDEQSHPVEQVTWGDATNYCARLTEQERASGRIPNGYIYRLPTEAEWEYACRAGTTTAFGYGSKLESGMANFRGQQEYDSSVGTTNNPAGVMIGRTTIVGSYAANGWGLYDMHGNVWEWCSDFWSESLSGGRVNDPLGPLTGVNRLIRGGSWAWSGAACRSAMRDTAPFGPNFPWWQTGFRVALARQ